MSSARSRVAQLEDKLVGRTDEPGTYCGRCGGLTIDQVLNASEMEDCSALGEGGTVLNWLDHGESSCRRCGSPTLAGTLADLDAQPDDPE